jgi:hypothetical protein
MKQLLRGEGTHELRESVAGKICALDAHIQKEVESVESGWRRMSSL